MDAGKVTILIPANVMEPDAVAALARKLEIALRRARLGAVMSHEEPGCDPFAPESLHSGREWHRIDVDMSTAVEFRRAAALFVAAGAPFSSHIIYTDRMRMCGETLGLSA